jgi:hypothetical protein
MLFVDFWLKRNSKNRSDAPYKIRRRRNRRGNHKKLENDWFLISGNPRVLPSCPRAFFAPTPPSPAPPPPDFTVFVRCTTGPVYRLGLAINRCYQSDYRCDRPVLVHRVPVSASLLVHLHNLQRDLL